MKRSRNSKRHYRVVCAAVVNIVSFMRVTELPHLFLGFKLISVVCNLFCKPADFKVLENFAGQSEFLICVASTHKSA